MAIQANVGTLTARLVADTTQFARGLRDAESQLRKTQSNLQAVGRSMSDVGQRLTRNVSLPVAAAGVAVVKMAGDFQYSMNRVGALTQATGADLQSLNDTARELGATTQFSAGQAADGMAFLAQAGFEANDIVDAMPGTLDLAAAGQLGLAEAADISSNVLTGFALAAEESGRVSDILAAASIRTNTNVQQLGEAMKYVAPVATSAGVSIEETAAAVGLLGNAGIQGSMAGTTLRGAITKLLTPSGEAADIIERLGLQVLDADGNMVSFESIVRQLGDAGASTADLMTVFGQRAGPGMAALIEQGADALADMTGEMETSGGTAARVAERQMEGFNGQMLKLRSALEALAISIGESGLLEFVTDIAESLTGLISRLSEANPKLLNLSAAVAGIVAIGGPVLSILGSMATNIAAFPALTGAASAGLRNLFSLQGGALAAAVVGITYLDGKIEELRASFLGIDVPVESLMEDLGRLADTGDLSGDLDRLINGTSLATDNLDDVVKAAGQMDAIPGFLTGLLARTPFGELIEPFNDQIERLELLDEALAGMVTSGNLEAAGAGFGAMVDALEGTDTSLQELLEHMPELNEMLGDTGLQNLETLLAAGVAPGEALARALQGVSNGLGVTERSLQGQADRWNAMPGAVEAAESALGPVQSALGDLEPELEAISDALDEVTEAWDTLTGRFIDERQALIDVEEAFAELADLDEEVARTLDISTEAGRENQEMLLGLITSAIDLRDAQIEAGGSVDDANGSFIDSVARLEDMAASLGFSREEVRRLIDELNILESVRVQPIILTADDGLSDLQTRLQEIFGQEYTLRVNDSYTPPSTIVPLPGADPTPEDVVSGGGPVNARQFGGPVTSGSPYLVGERGPEMFVPEGNGSIVPTDQMGAGGGANITIHVNGGGGSINPTMIAESVAVELRELALMNSLGI